jgi:predicted metalloendopeptidase
MGKTKKNGNCKNKTQRRVYEPFENIIKPETITVEKEINEIFKTPFVPSKITPKNDYYSYINYKWMKTAKAQKGAEYIIQLDDFRIVQHKVYLELLNIVKDYTKNNHTKKSTEISNFYKSFIKGSSLNEIKEYGRSTLRMIDTMRENPANLWKLLGTMNRNEIISWGLPFTYNLFGDDKHPDIYRCVISSPKLTLIDDSLYFPDDDLTDKKYKNNYLKHYFIYLEELFTFVFGKNHGFTVSDVYDVEVEIFNNFNCTKQKENVEYYNVITKKEALTKYNFNWEEFSHWVGYKSCPDFFITSSLNYLDCCTQLLLKEWTSEKWRTYFIYIYIRQLVRFNQAGYSLYYKFNGKFVTGQDDELPQELGPVFGLGYAFNTFFTNEYIDKYKNDEMIQYLEGLSEDLKQVFIRIIESNTWLQPKTKSYALLKLKHLKLIVGSPKLLREDPLLNYSDSDAWGNLLKIADWRINQNVLLEGKKLVDVPDIDWSLTPPKFVGTQAYVVNASYTPSLNSIYVPLGYIQKPFIDLDQRGIEYNLAHIGYTLTHEMSHALDDLGSQYDYTGKLHDWWTKKDKQKYKQIQRDIIKQYEVFAKYDGIIFDAEPSIGEDLADISGLAICLKYLRDFQHKNEDIIPIRSLSYKAMFIYFASQQRQKINKNALNAQLKTNPHPLDKYRTNVPLSRMKIFRTIYNITKKDKMYWNSTNTIW